MPDLALQLPPGGQRLLNTIFDGPSPSKLTGAELAERCGISVADLVGMSSWGRGLICAVNPDGDDVTMAPDAEIANDLKAFRLRLTARGRDWVQTNPANVMMRLIANANNRGMDLHRLQQQMVEASTIRDAVDAGLAGILHGSGYHASGGEVSPAEWRRIFRTPKDFNISLTNRGMHTVGRAS